jgi:hypothetical protein
MSALPALPKALHGVIADAHGRRADTDGPGAVAASRVSLDGRGAREGYGGESKSESGGDDFHDFFSDAMMSPYTMALPMSESTTMPRNAPATTGESHTRNAPNARARASMIFMLSTYGHTVRKAKGDARAR